MFMILHIPELETLSKEDLINKLKDVDDHRNLLLLLNIKRNESDIHEIVKIGSWFIDKFNILLKLNMN